MASNWVTWTAPSSFEMITSDTWPGRSSPCWEASILQSNIASTSLLLGHADVVRVRLLLWWSVSTSHYLEVSLSMVPNIIIIGDQISYDSQSQLTWAWASKYIRSEKNLRRIVPQSRCNLVSSNSATHVSFEGYNSRSTIEAEYIWALLFSIREVHPLIDFVDGIDQNARRAGYWFIRHIRKTPRMHPGSIDEHGRRIFQVNFSLFSVSIQGSGFPAAT